MFLPGEDKKENGTSSRTATHHSSSKTQALGNAVDQRLANQKQPKCRQSIGCRSIRSIYTVRPFIILIWYNFRLHKHKTTFKTPSLTTKKKTIKRKLTTRETTITTSTTPQSQLEQQQQLICLKFQASWGWLCDPYQSSNYIQKPKEVQILTIPLKTEHQKHLIFN